MADEITLKSVREHIVAMDGRFSARFESLENEVRSGFAGLTHQIDAIDGRVDDLEIETLPKKGQSFGGDVVVVIGELR